MTPHSLPLMSIYFVLRRSMDVFRAFDSFAQKGLSQKSTFRAFRLAHSRDLRPHWGECVVSMCLGMWIDWARKGCVRCVGTRALESAARGDHANRLLLQVLRQRPRVSSSDASARAAVQMCLEAKEALARARWPKGNASLALGRARWPKGNALRGSGWGVRGRKALPSRASSLAKA